jgi:hypothetical protein
MTEKTPSSSSMRAAGFLWLIVSVVLALVWSYYSSEWWSVAIGVVAVFFFIEAIAHMNVYSVMVDIMPAPQKRETAKSVE